MILNIDWVSKVVTVPQASLTLVLGTLYELDTDAFRLALKDLEASVEGITHPDIHSHNAQYTVAGVTYQQKLEIINGYKIEFENGLYSVRLVGSNNNLFDIQSGILVQNTVQVIPNNSAGAIVQTVGSGVTASDITDIANAVNSILQDDFANIKSPIDAIHKANFNKRKWDKVGNTLTIYEADGTTVAYQFNTNSDMSEIIPA